VSEGPISLGWTLAIQLLASMSIVHGSCVGGAAAVSIGMPASRVGAFIGIAYVAAYCSAVCGRVSFSGSA